MSAPIPLTLLAGFLGAGKTTLLNRILEADHGLRLAVLVNDFGAINIDAALITGVQQDTISLANGCICCTVSNDLLRVLQGIHATEPPPEHIIIEASGVADPLTLQQTFNRPDFAPLVRVENVLAVVDAERILDWDAVFHDLPQNQVQAASVILLNKVDLVDADERQQVREWVRGHAPHAQIIETTYCAVPLDLILTAGHFDLDALLARSPLAVHVHEAGAHHDHGSAFDTWHWHSSARLDRAALTAAAETLPDGVLRAKGVLRLADAPDRRTVLHVVGRRVTLADGGAWPGPALSSLVVIGLPGAVVPADMQARFDACGV